MSEKFCLARLAVSLAGIGLSNKSVLNI
jgi:hypothetical protein